MPSFNFKNLNPSYIWRNIRFDKVVFICLISLVVFGLIAQSSVSQGAFFQKQLIFAFLGIPVFYVGYILPTETLKKLCWFAYGFAVMLLLWVLVQGTTALGAQRWITVGGFSIQPSEPAKIACIIALAYWFQNHKPSSIFKVIKAGSLIMLLPFGLIFIQPDLGTSLVLVAIFFSMVYWAGAKISQVLVLISPLIVMITSALGKRIYFAPSLKVGSHYITLDCSVVGLICIISIVAYLAYHYKVWKSKWRSFWLSFYSFVIFLIAILGRPLAWDLLEPYQQKRLTIFLDPQVDPLGAGYNIIQSLIAIGSGGFLGQGYKHGRLTQGQFVPEQHTDFIFSSIAEEWGFVTCFLIILAFFTICLRLYNLTKNVDDVFSRLIVVGVMAFLCFHVCVNIGMNIGLMPVTGVPLPLLSYGGTSLWVNLFSLGITQRIYSNNAPPTLFR
ncbi:MAG: rod shape-determining protein RodA [Candidatus Caenarcaniphilales bacterium]|nr:rod shape-determining protein RodA [Candidatus Caenarcaniphilales bacterium]